MIMTSRAVRVLAIACVLSLLSIDRLSADEKKSIPWAEIARIVGELGQQDASKMTPEQKREALARALANYGMRQHEIDVAEAGRDQINIYNGRQDNQNASVEEFLPENVIYSDGSFSPAPGYVWVDGANPNDLRVKKESVRENVITVNGKLRPAPGYTWVDRDDPDNFNVRRREDRVLYNLLFGKWDDKNDNGVIDGIREIKQIRKKFRVGDQMRAYFCQETTENVKGEKVIMRVLREDGSVYAEGIGENQEEDQRVICRTFHETEYFKPGKYQLAWYSEDGTLLSIKEFEVVKK